MTPKGLWERVMRGGIHAEASPAEVRCITLVNVIASLCIFLTLATWIGARVSRSGHVVNLVSVLCFGAVLALNHRGGTTSAAILLSALATIATAAGALTSGLHAGTQYYLLPVSMVPFFIFPPRETRVAAALAAFSVVVLVVLVLASGALAGLAQGRPAQREYATYAAGIVVGTVVVGYYARATATSAERSLAIARERSQALLENVFPPSIAARLKASEGAIADSHEEVTVLVSDIAGFTRLAETMSPEALVGLLREIFSAFDELCDRHGVEKIKTVGDAYIAAAGVPLARPDHAEVVAELALAMLGAVDAACARSAAPIRIRIGIASGPVVAGVIGRRSYSYDLWGDALDAAMALEAEGLPGEIGIAAKTRDLIEARYTCVPRGEAAGASGAATGYLLLGRRAIGEAA